MATFLCRAFWQGRLVSLIFGILKKFKIGENVIYFVIGVKSFEI